MHGATSRAPLHDVALLSFDRCYCYWPKPAHGPKHFTAARVHGRLSRHATLPFQQLITIRGTKTTFPPA